MSQDGQREIEKPNGITDEERKKKNRNLFGIRWGRTNACFYGAEECNLCKSLAIAYIWLADYYSLPGLLLNSLWPPIDECHVRKCGVSHSMRARGPQEERIESKWEPKKYESICHSCELYSQEVDLGQCVDGGMLSIQSRWLLISCPLALSLSLRMHARARVCYLIVKFVIRVPNLAN